MKGLRLAGVDLAVPAARGHGSRRLVRDLDLTVRPGKVAAVVGCNGSGKSTLLRAAAGLLRPARGRVEVDGAPLPGLSPRRRALLVGYLPQRIPLTENLTVRDLAALGRHPHGGGVGRPGDPMVDAALARVGLSALAGRRVFGLSGGEFQRARIARLLATCAPYLVLDEPTTALDPRHALEIADLVRELARSGHGILLAVHDLELARRHADTVVCLGGAHGDPWHRVGAPAEVLTPETLAAAFGVRATLWPNAIGFERLGGASEPSG